MNALRRRRDRERGAVALEFALILPVLLLLVFGIVDFARAYNAQVSLTHAAREGVRVLALGGTAAEATTQTESAITSVDTDAVTISTPGVCPDPPVGADAVVEVEHGFTYVTPLGSLMELFGGSGLGELTLSGRGVMRCGG